MDYSQNFYNELSIVNIPCINFISDIGYSKFFITNYSLPFYNKETLIMRNLCCLFAYLIKKYNINYIYRLFYNTSDYDFKYLDKLNSIFNKVLLHKKFFKFFNFMPFLVKNTYKKLIKIKDNNFLIYAFFFNIEILFKYKKQYVPFFKKKKLILSNKNKDIRCVVFKTIIFADSVIFYFKLLKLNFIDLYLYKKKILN
jgi:hypothetical protein